MQMRDPFDYFDLIVNTASTLAAAFAGAWAAFEFEKTRRQRERSEDLAAAGDRALFTLASMWDRLKQYDSEIAKKHKGKDDAWINLDASPSITDIPFAFEVKELSPLMNNTPNILQVLLLEEMRFKLLSSTVERRSALLLNSVWPRLSGAGFKMGTPVPEDELKAAIGEDLVKQLSVYADQILGNIDDNMRSLEDAFNTLRSALKATFPGRKFLTFSFPHDEAPQAKAAPGNTGG